MSNGVPKRNVRASNDATSDYARIAKRPATVSVAGTRVAGRQAVAIVAGEHALPRRLRFFAIWRTVGSFCLAGTTPADILELLEGLSAPGARGNLSSSLTDHVRL